MVKLWGKAGVSPESRAHWTLGMSIVQVRVYLSRFFRQRSHLPTFTYSTLTKFMSWRDSNRERVAQQVNENKTRHLSHGILIDRKQLIDIQPWLCGIGDDHPVPCTLETDSGLRSAKDANSRDDGWTHVVGGDGGKCVFARKKCERRPACCCSQPISWLSLVKEFLLLSL